MHKANKHADCLAKVSWPDTVDRQETLQILQGRSAREIERRGRALSQSDGGRPQNWTHPAPTPSTRPVMRACMTGHDMRLPSVDLLLTLLMTIDMGHARPPLSVRIGKPAGPIHPVPRGLGGRRLLLARQPTPSSARFICHERTFPLPRLASTWQCSSHSSSDVTASNSSRCKKNRPRINKQVH